MSRLYLIRHGQAGTRNAYDSLSELGRRQARLLGAYFAAEGVRFTAAYSGSLERQCLTAQGTRAACLEAGGYFPEVEERSDWNEFDLSEIYRHLAPRLSAKDPEFEREYDAMRTAARAAAGEHGAMVNRRWMPCDTQVVEAWLQGRFDYDGERWEDFHRRVTGCRNEIAEAGREANIVVFTSAAPIGIWTALSMDICDGRAMRLAGALQNASCTVLRVDERQVALRSFNSIAHLRDPELRTYR